MKIIGHEKIIKLLEKCIKKDRVSQAYIFSGLESVGKFTVALNFAERLLGRDPSTDSTSSSQASLGRVDSDLTILEPEIEIVKGITKKRDIKIEKIRELQHELGLSIGKGKYKIAIINDADRLNRSAQNALLKNLEEPHAGTVIILIVQNEKKMLPTIISRCQKIRFNPVSEAELGKNIPASEKNRNEILFWSLGRPGLMLELIKNKEELADRKESLQELKNLLGGNVSEKFSLAERLSKDSGLAIKKINLWLIVIRETLLGKKGLVDIPREKSLILSEKIDSSLELLKDTNSNARLVLENLFLNF